MKTLQLDGEEYVKASEAAKTHGYTSDYVGQLCRAGKVKAELVGRSWYVNIESLLKHRKNRYRSNQKKTIEAVQEALTEQKEEAEKPNYYSRVTHPPIRYDQDTTEAIPALRRASVETNPGSVADEPQELTVTEATEEPVTYEVEAVKQEPPRQAVLDVTEPDEDNNEDTPQNTHTPKKETKFTEKTKVFSKDDVTDIAPRVIREGLVPKKRQRQERRVASVVAVTASNVTNQTAHSNVTQSSVSTLGVWSLAPTALSLCLGLLVAGLMVGVGWHFEGGELGEEAGYRFSLSTVITSINQ